MIDLSRYKIDYTKVCSNKRLVYFYETKNFREIIVGIHGLKSSETSGAILKTSGCGATYASKEYCKQNSRNSFYINTDNSLKETLSDFLYQLGYDFRPQYYYESVDVKFLIQALKYHFKSVLKTGPRILIVDDFHLLKGAKLASFIRLIKETESVLTFCLITTSKFMFKHENKSNDSNVSKAVGQTVDDWKNIVPVEFEEKASICYLSGLRDQSLIDRIANETKNLNQLYKALRRIHRFAKRQIEDSK